MSFETERMFVVRRSNQVCETYQIRKDDRDKYCATVNANSVNMCIHFLEIH